jgi:lipopolysaccharide export system protein LptC
MKSTRFILWVVVAAMVLMGAGYAAWSQTFTISSTVQTGELYVYIAETHTVEVQEADGEYYTEGNSYLDLENLVTTTTSQNAAGDETTISTLSYKVGDVYPGTRIKTTFTFHNKGTLKARVIFDENNSYVNNAGNELWKNIIFTVNDAQVTVNDTTESVKANIANAILTEIGTELEPGDVRVVTIVQELPRNSGDETEGKSLDWGMVFQFEQ